MRPTILASVLQFDQNVRDRFEENGIGVELSGFSLPEFLDERALPLAIKVAKQWLSGFTQPVSMHGAFMNLQIMSRDPWLVDVCHRRIEQSIEIANELGIGHVVFHTNYPHSSSVNHRSRWVESQIAFWTKVIPIAERNGVIAHLENTTELDASFLTDITRQLNHPNISTCLDTGHTHCFAHTKIPPADWVRGLGNDLTYIHLHSNHQIHDEHLAYTQGTIPFDGFWEALDALEKYPWIIIEVKSKEAFDESLRALKERFGF